MIVTWGMIGMWAASVGGASLDDAQDASKLRRFEYSQIHMGVAVRITLYTETEAQAESAAKAAYARFAELEQVMSDYRPASEIMVALTKAHREPVPVSRDLYRVLRRALDIAEASDGAFDPTVGPLVSLWREARRSGALPTSEAIAAAKEKVGWRYVQLDSRTRTMRITREGVRVDFGGIAKGDACDQAIQVLRNLGVARASVESGGDIHFLGSPPGSSGWLVSILNRQGRMILADKAISTSGDAEQFVEIGGVRYSHIVDPKTGLGLTNRLQASVIANSGLTTDPLATALCVMGEEASRDLVRKYRVRAFFVRPKEG